MSRAVWLSLLLLACDDSIRLVLVESGGSGALTLGGSNGDGAAAGDVAASAGDGGSAASTLGGSAGNGASAGSDVGVGGAVPPWDAPALYTASFVSYLYPGQYIHYVDTEGFIAPIDLASQAEKESASFEIIPGLWDDECISFRPVGMAGRLLRHAGSRILLHVADDVPLFLADSTFCPEPSKADPEGISFRCTNYPQRMIHLRNKNELWIDDILDTPEFAAETTFYREAPLNQAP